MGQIADAVMQITGALGVAVVIEAKHICMMMRGVEKQNSSMITSVMLSEFRDNAATRSEFLSLRFQVSCAPSFTPMRLLL